jgi:microcystin-dependent protein
MSEPYVGEIRMFAGNFAPRGWAFCDGQLLAVSSNDALFSLLGTIYGGDGRTTFGLPDVRGRLPIHAGIGPGLTPRKLGAKAGAEKVTLTANQLGSHTHGVRCRGSAGNSNDPTGKVWASVTSGGGFYNTTLNMPKDFPADASAQAGGGRSHNNLQPALCVNFIIALFGVYPSRS